MFTNLEIALLWTLEQKRPLLPVSNRLRAESFNASRVMREEGYRQPGQALKRLSKCLSRTGSESTRRGHSTRKGL